MPGAIHSVLLVGIGGLAKELSGELSARGIPAREATLMQLTGAEGTDALLVLGPAAARTARLDVVRPYQSGDRPIVVLSHAEGAADQLRSLSAGRVLHVPPTGSVVQIATAIVKAVAPEWEGAETVRPPPAALPPEVMAEMTGNSPRSEPPEELDSSLLESVRPAAPPQPPPAPAAAPAAAPPSPPLAAEAARDWPEPELPRPKEKRSIPVFVWGGALAGLIGMIAIVALVIVLSTGSDDGETPGPSAPEEAAAVPALPAEQDPAPVDEPSTEIDEPSTETTGTDVVEPEEVAIAPSDPAPSALLSPEEQLAAARGADAPRDPRESDALTAQAHRALSAGEIATADEQLARALALDPDNPRAWAGLGRLAVVKGQPAIGVRWLELAVQARGRRAEYHLWLGDAHRAAGDEAAARRAWESALRRDPESSEVRSRLR